MTLFAGIFSRNEHQPILDSVCDGLRRDVTRNKPDEVRTFSDNRCCLLKVDIGAFAEPAFRIDEDGSVSILAGEPLVACDGDTRGHNRSKDLDLLPWKSYPGHEPCPLPAKQKVAYQWDGEFQIEQATALKAMLLDQASQMLRATDFPKTELRKQYLRIATLIYKFGLRDYRYVIQAAWNYYTYWKLSGGKHVLPSTIGDDGSNTIDRRSRRFGTGLVWRHRHVRPPR